MLWEADFIATILFPVRGHVIFLQHSFLRHFPATQVSTLSHTFELFKQQQACEVFVDETLNPSRHWCFVVVPFYGKKSREEAQCNLNNTG